MNVSAIIKRSVWIAAVAVLCSGAISAQPTASQSDINNSDARIFLSSSERPQAQLSFGVARATGMVRATAGDAPTFDFTMYPANQGSDDGERNGDATVISFHSRSVEKLSDQSYRATGVLTVTDVERTETYDPSEAHSGPTYGPSKTYSIKRDATFEFHPVRQGTTNGGTPYTDWLASALIVGREFPELLLAISTTAWPDYTVAENCTTLTVDDDFSGPSCTGGSTVAADAGSGIHCGLPPTIGEDFSGEICQAAPLQVPTPRDIRQMAKGDDPPVHKDLVADQVQIVVHLRVSAGHPAVAATEGR